ncbi:MAG: type II secretion system GspH family protein [Planctomycetaceae bacterium]|jgi:prepilin-type N-terminal cleavage/methylation domain-containing protein|nr:type II secretion system GspH family protein [Planctomycetaceae bacterium]
MNAVNKTNQPIRFTHRRIFSRKAFTLVEMLIVAVIIVILAGLTLAAVHAAAASAKEAKTRATIQKIDAAVLQIFSDYDRKFARIKHRLEQDNTLTEEERYKTALHFIRDLMRMEMPQSWAEVYDSESTKDPKEPLKPIAYGGRKLADKRADAPPVFRHYYQTYCQIKKNTGKDPGRAALLFLIIQNLNPDALTFFHSNEIQDTDGDGLPEFVDAWGRPIQFLRWAPAFPGSDLQPDVLKLANYVPDPNIETNSKWWKNPDSQLKQAFQTATAVYPDPLDDHHVDDHHVFGGWFLYPLIYSAGPDGEYDLTSRTVKQGTDTDISPTLESADQILDPFKLPYGMPGNDGSSNLQHNDNIHNHRWNRSF